MPELGLTRNVAMVIAAGGVTLWLKPWEQRVEAAPIKNMAFLLLDKPSFAVLPFTNLSGDPTQETFADGMTDNLITDLSKIFDLFFVARNSTFVNKGKSVEIRKVLSGVAREQEIADLVPGRTHVACEQCWVFWFVHSQSNRATSAF